MTTQSKRLLDAACSLMIIASSGYIAQMGYQFGRFLAGH